MMNNLQFVSGKGLFCKIYLHFSLRIIAAILRLTTDYDYNIIINTILLLLSKILAL